MVTVVGGRLAWWYHAHSMCDYILTRLTNDWNYENYIIVKVTLLFIYLFYIRYEITEKKHLLEWNDCESWKNHFWQSVANDYDKKNFCARFYSKILLMGNTRSENENVIFNDLWYRVPLEKFLRILSYRQNNHFDYYLSPLW